jgi:carbonic anhydrase
MHLPRTEPLEKDDSAFVDAVARENVVMTIANVRQRSPVLRDLESNGSIKTAGAMYNLQTGTVEFFA